MGVLKYLLNIAALILSIINGWFLFNYYIKDKPKLEVNAIHPDFYQWWFELPEGKTKENKKLENMGF